MELVEPLEQLAEHSPLARVRLQRQWTVEETARRAGISEEYVRWLEEGRVYRFPCADDALLAALLYGTALGIDNREARVLAGLPVPPAPVERNPLPRLLVLGVILVALVVVAAVVLIPHGRSGGNRTANAVVLPPPWRVDVNILNGSGDINYTRQLASRVQALGYTVKHVGRADSFAYPQTAVYFPPRCEGVAVRLARQLGVETQPLPGGTGACHLYVIVGPARGPGE